MDDYEGEVDTTPDEDGLLNRGEMTFDGFDDGNIPVDIWLEELDKDETQEAYEAGYRYSIRCGNYMPRKGAASENVVVAYAKDKETIQKAMRKYIIPIYQTALDKLNKMAETGTGDLYYWDND